MGMTFHEAGKIQKSFDGKAQYPACSICCPLMNGDRHAAVQYNCRQESRCNIKWLIAVWSG